jgi:hypothetical protein
VSTSNVEQLARQSRSFRVADLTVHSEPPAVNKQGYTGSVKVVVPHPDTKALVYGYIVGEKITGTRFVLVKTVDKKPARYDDKGVVVKAGTKQRFDLYLCVNSSGRSVAHAETPVPLKAIAQRVAKKELAVEYEMRQEGSVEYPVATGDFAVAISAFLATVAPHGEVVEQVVEQVAPSAPVVEKTGPATEQTDLFALPVDEEEQRLIEGLWWA